MGSQTWEEAPWNGGPLLAWREATSKASPLDAEEEKETRARRRYEEGGARGGPVDFFFSHHHRFLAREKKNHCSGGVCEATEEETAKNFH